MHKYLWLFGALLALIAGGVIPVSHAVPTVQGAVSGKKVCKIVKKHGKKKKVCHTVATAPKPTSTPAATPTATPNPLLVANPLNVTIRVDSGHAVHKRIPASGGSMTTTDANGTKFTLTFPDGALLSDEDITLTPISSLSGAPLSGGLVGAVRLEPDGLQLMHPASLVIEPAKAVPTASDISFSGQGDGKDFHLYPGQYTSEQITLNLQHFSQAGVGQGSPADVVTILQHAPSAPQWRVEQIQAAITRDGLSENTVGLMQAAWDDWYEHYVLPQLLNAAEYGQTADDVRGPITNGLVWMRANEISVGSRDPQYPQRAATIWDLIDKALTNVYNEAKRKCAVEHDFHQIVLMAAIERSREILGSPHTNSNVFTDVRKCLTFELTYDSDTLSVSVPNDGGTPTFEVHARVEHVPIVPNVNGTGGFAPVTQPLQLINAQGSGMGSCNAAYSQLPALNPFRIDSADMSIDMNAPNGTVSIPQVQSLVISPGSFGPSPLGATCVGIETAVAESYLYAWLDLHAGEQVGDYQRDAFRITDWTPTSPGTWTKTYDRTSEYHPGIGTYTEHTTLTLVHNPHF